MFPYSITAYESNKQRNTRCILIKYKYDFPKKIKIKDMYSADYNRVLWTYWLTLKPVRFHTHGSLI